MSNLYQQYYTKSSDLTSYMLSKLRVRPKSLVLEPSAGDGVFVDLLIDLGIDLQIDALEMDSVEARRLSDKYKNLANVRVKNTDTLLDAEMISAMASGGKYDFIIANPPYGAWQEFDKRDELRKVYPELYIKETYSTFLFQAISLLKEGGRLVFINPDTFLNLHRHSALRKAILEKTMIDEIVVFPSSFFPNVNFGYSNLSIISLERVATKTAALSNTFSVRTGFRKPSELLADSPSQICHRMDQASVLLSMDHAFLVSNDGRIKELLQNCKTRLGDIADCVTGFYSGNDKKYVKVVDTTLKNAAAYDKVDASQICDVTLPSLDGISGSRCFIPLMKGGGSRYIKRTNSFLDWSKESVRHYRTDKKARFQNSQFYFQDGIGIPMVSSKNVTGALIEGRIIDQAIVGVFPHEKQYLHFLLGLLNSTIATNLLRTINPSANNSANYLKKIPIVIPDQLTLEHISTLVATVCTQKKLAIDTEVVEAQIDDIFTVIYTEEHDSFVQNVIQSELAFT